MCSKSRRFFCWRAGFRQVYLLGDRIVRRGIGIDVEDGDQARDKAPPLRPDFQLTFVDGQPISHFKFDGIRVRSGNLEVFVQLTRR